MARKKHPEEPENHERWLVSYADFITLMFAFFVVMFASSQTDKGSAAQVSESVKKALEENHLAASINVILGGTVDNNGTGNAMMRGPGGTKKSSAEVKPTKIAELVPSEQFLTKQLKSEIESGKIRIHMGARGLVVSLQEAAFFSPGDDGVSEEAYHSIEKIAESIRQLPNPVRLEGHTDSKPIHNSRFRSNWELSVARSIAMLEMFTKQFDVPVTKLAVAGYADTIPVDTNDSPEGRARNRRVDIVILNQSGLTSDAASDPKPAEKPSALGGVKP